MVYQTCGFSCRNIRCLYNISYFFEKRKGKSDQIKKRKMNFIHHNKIFCSVIEYKTCNCSPVQTPHPEENSTNCIMSNSVFT